MKGRRQPRLSTEGHGLLARGALLPFLSYMFFGVGISRFELIPQKKLILSGSPEQSRRARDRNPKGACFMFLMKHAGYDSVLLAEEEFFLSPFARMSRALTIDASR